MSVSHDTRAPDRTTAELLDQATAEAQQIARFGPQFLMTVDQAAKAMQVSRTGVFVMIRNGQIDSVLIGERRRRIPVSAIRDFIDRQLAADDGRR